jgi:hypothetical protein
VLTDELEGLLAARERRLEAQPLHPQVQHFCGLFVHQRHLMRGAIKEATVTDEGAIKEATVTDEGSHQGGDRH